MRRARALLLRAHRVFSLLGAFWLGLLGATGSTLVFHEEIDAALSPAFHATAPSSGEPLSLDALAEAAASTRPGSFTRYLDLPDREGEPVRAFLGSLPSGPVLPDGLELALDPASGRLQAHRARGELALDRERLVPFLYRFHYSLQLGPTATWALGVLAGLWLLDHAAALVLVFPTPRRWAESFRVRRGARGHRLVFDLHRALGLWLLPATLVLSLSGFYFNWPEPVRAAASLFSDFTARDDRAREKLAAPLHAPPLGFAAAVRIASARASGARVDGISYDPATGSYFANVVDPRDYDESGWRWIFVDARSGSVLSDHHPADGTLADRFAAWQFPLHSGKAFGWPGRLVIFAAGIGLCLISVTGVLIWSRRRCARVRSPGERARTRRPAPAARGRTERLPVAAFSSLPLRETR